MNAEPEPRRARVRAELLAAAAAALMLISAVAFILGKPIAGAGAAALAIAVATAASLAVRLEFWAADRAVAEAEQTAARAEAAKGRFLAVLNHDMRQPLQAISLYATALHKRVSTDDARDILGKLDRATEALSDMLTRLAAYREFSGGPLNATTAPTPLAPILTRVCAAHAGLSLPAEIDMQAVTDGALLERLLGALAQNAMRHGGGGRIELTRDGGEIDIAVVDDGPGIAEEDQAKAFEEFVRLDGARGSGLGLGLAEAQHIARALGADIRLHSASGQGARFSVRLRAA